MLLITTKCLFTHACGKRLINVNPCHGIMLSALLGERPPKRQRLMLTRDEIQLLLAHDACPRGHEVTVIESADGGPPTVVGLINWTTLEAVNYVEIDPPPLLRGWDLSVLVLLCIGVIWWSGNAAPVSPSRRERAGCRSLRPRERCGVRFGQGRSTSRSPGSRARLCGPTGRSTHRPWTREMLWHSGAGDEQVRRTHEVAGVPMPSARLCHPGPIFPLQLPAERGWQ
jgi:hypothetical protein